MADTSRLYRLLAQRLEAVRAQQLESLGDGVAVDFSSYKDIVGYLRGLKDAISIAEEVDKGIE